jgi:hypothetical protein
MQLMAPNCIRVVAAEVHVRGGRLSEALPQSHAGIRPLYEMADLQWCAPGPAHSLEFYSLACALRLNRRHCR